MRNENWSRQLNEHITVTQQRYLNTGLVWGSMDCCTFAFDWVKICTGVDPMVDFRGRYSDQRSALEAIKDAGDRSLLDAMKKRLGVPVPAAQAMRGDVAYRHDERAVGIFMTQGARMVAAFLSEKGVGFVPAKSVDFGFRIE